MEENILHSSQQPTIENPKRPQFLTVLCILSYIWSGFILLCLFLCLLFSRFLFTVIGNILSGEISVPTLDSAQEQALQSLLDLGQGKFAAIIAGAIILYMTTLLGVFKMWRQQKTGFYIYAAINVFGVIYDVFSGSYFMAIISIAFIVMYFLNLKDMK